ncbi:MAG: sensor histidine kinase [Flavobacteriaceae bacterium]|nr:sensor histidine kinase [Flavobacteriaceae bacterium]
MDLSDKKVTRYIKHMLFWIAVWLFYSFFFSYNNSDLNYVLVFSTMLVPITAIPTYLVVKVLIPNYLNPKKYVLFGIYNLSVFLLTTLFIILLLSLSIAFIDYFKFKDLPPMGRSYAYLITLVYLIVLLVSFENIWKKNTQIAEQNHALENRLLIEKLKAKEHELNYLKNQLHPHFLFNTLNTIYGLALKKSENIPEITLKLSGLLDYVLYQTNKETVTLQDEIAHLEQYIDLEKIRFNDCLKVTLTKEIGNQKLPIAPLLLLPFVENAFKHGAVTDDYLQVLITISVIDNVLDFRIKNTSDKKETREGIGLKNVKERLKILYPKNHDLQIDSKTNWFEVHLKINL